MPLVVFERFDHAAGNAQDTTPVYIKVDPPALRVDLSIFDNSVMVSFSPDGVSFNQEVEFQPGVIASLDLKVRKIGFRNKTVASTGRYDVRFFSNPIEVVGKQLDPTAKL